MPVDSKKTKAVSSDQEIKVLSEISSLIQATPPEKDVFEDALKCLGKIVDFRSASLYLFSKESFKLEEVCTVGRKVDLIGFVNFDMGSGISAWVAKHRRPIVLNNLRKSKDGTHTKSFISVPIIFGKEILGVINLAHDETDSYSQRDAEIVTIASSILALLIERISHKEALETKSRAIEVLAAELESAREHHYTEKKGNLALEQAQAFSKHISNPLAIISGNAQFLIMTVKGSNPSAVKRLNAIDREVANIQAALKDLCGAPSSRNSELSVFSREKEYSLPGA